MLFGLAQPCVHCELHRWALSEAETSATSRTGLPRPLVAALSASVGHPVCCRVVVAVVRTAGEHGRRFCQGRGPPSQSRFARSPGSRTGANSRPPAARTGSQRTGRLQRQSFGAAVVRPRWVDLPSSALPDTSPTHSLRLTCRCLQVSSRRCAYVSWSGRDFIPSDSEPLGAHRWSSSTKPSRGAISARPHPLVAPMSALANRRRSVRKLSVS